MSTILAVNFGSSSLKTALFSVGDPAPDSRPQRLVRARIARLADRRLSLEWEGGGDERQVEGDPLAAIADALAAAGFPEPDTVGHRFVHGGDYASAQLIDDAVLPELRRLAAWAPQHQPASLEGVAASSRRWPGAAQVASFDSAFHRTMPEVAQRLPLPADLWEEGVRRYGFHGLSCEHIVEEVGAEQLGKAVVAHLGNGTSLTAIADGRSIDTTMCFTPDAGLFMGSRSGDLDPGILLYLAEREHRPMSTAELRTLVQERAGLRGISGGESDMAALLDRDDPAARLAVESYCRQVAKNVGAYATVLDGIDTLVYTGGIGEHAAAVRDAVTARLGSLGIGRVLVVPTDEETVIARHAADVTNG